MSEKNIRVLYFGDVYAKPGREALKAALKKIVPQHAVDFVVVNGENVTHGYGIQPEMAEELFSAGVDVITTGNHAWDQKTIIPYMATTTRLIRPLNYPDHPLYRVPGRGSTVVECQRRRFTNGKSPLLGVVQVMGRVFMDTLDCPFRAAEKEIDRMQGLGINAILVDMHAEATSEKQAIAHFLDGKASAVVGSHSHVQTADERILPGGTAAITDVGMTGVYDSVIGVRKDLSIQRFLTRRPIKYEAAEGRPGYGCVLVTIDSESGRAVRIERFREVEIELT